MPKDGENKKKEAPAGKRAKAEAAEEATKAAQKAAAEAADYAAQKVALNPAVAFLQKQKEKEAGQQPSATPEPVSFKKVEPEPVPEPEPLEESFVDGSFRSTEETAAMHCRAHGGGLTEATVSKHAFFWIEAHDGANRRRTVGGDSFFVAIRGPSQVRARAVEPPRQSAHKTAEPSQPNGLCSDASCLLCPRLFFCPRSRLPT